MGLIFLVSPCIIAEIAVFYYGSTTLRIQIQLVYSYYEHKNGDKDDPNRLLIIDILNVSCRHKCKRNRGELEISQYFYRKTFCYLDNISRKVFYRYNSLKLP